MIAVLQAEEADVRRCRGGVKAPQIARGIRLPALHARLQVRRLPEDTLACFGAAALVAGPNMQEAVSRCHRGT